MVFLPRSSFVALTATVIASNCISSTEARFALLRLRSALIGAVVHQLAAILLDIATQMYSGVKTATRQSCP
eukprot:6206-Heterococcus_DN1.PRE.1